MGNEYLEFKIDNEERFSMLQKFFVRLKADKDSDQIDEPEAYFEYIDNQAREYFWWPTDEEYDEWLERWYATPVEHGRTEPSLKNRWLFKAMIEHIENNEYDLVSCKITGPGVGRLEFYSYAYPYGGTEAMQALIECFGFAVTEIFYGAGPPRKL